MKTLYINCKVWQPDGTFDEAFGVSGELIDFSGSLSDANRIRQNYSSITDLEGKLVLPAFTDGHLHLVYGSMMRKRLDCRNVKTFDELADAIRNYAEHEPGRWIVGSNLNIPYVIDPSKYPDVNLADKLYIERPLFIANYDYHSALCNTSGMIETGLSVNSELNTEELVPLNDFGKPSGIIKEEALDFVFSNLPAPTVNQSADAVADFINVLHSYGITTVSDITLPPDLEVYNKLYSDGRLKLRVNSYVPFEEFPNLAAHRSYTSGIADKLFTINGFKAFYDGALGSSSGLFSMNYTGSNSAGIRTEMARSGELQRLALEIDEAQEQMIIHAIGDRAVTEVLDLAEELESVYGKRDRRLRVEHAQHIHPNDIERFRQLDVIVSAQPLHLKYDMKLVKDKLPEALWPTTHNYKQLIDRGVPVVFGTDFPIVEADPFATIQYAVTRTADGEEFTPEFKIPLHECIKAYTLDNAYSNFNEHAAGSIQKGKVADFVIMQDDLFKMEPDKISEAKVSKTYLGGKEVYSA